ncbi:sodium:proton antiporter [Clostridium novyi A str. 4552]|uniref:Sodium:proton antiporter n=1 Tax=Clostridium novyi A str. 4552 TaxID=1444289 RepID=A0A0A0IBE1_CLONO|nr:Na+/H+ antiporter NhaC family protein [Clostridium novyi]KGM97843.1 sodium:proton antiporter [Clostridium novyi A str. 4552]
MKNGSKKKGWIVGLLPLIIFLALYMGMGIYTGSFESLPLMVGILIASGIALALKKPSSKGETSTFEERVTLYCKGGGEHTLILMVIIFILAGAFYGVANAMHAVDSVTNIGLSILPSKMILPGIFIIACILSFSMGTSMGTVAALMPIAVDVASKTGFNIALVSGVVVGGAMFGDNLSFISDTTIAATRTQDVSMKDKFKANFLMVLPAVVVNCVVLALQPIGVATLNGTYNYNFINLVPYIVVIALSLIGWHVIIVMSLGVGSGILIGMLHGDFTLVKSLTIIHDGMKGMEDMAIIAILVGGLVSLMSSLGGIDYLLEKLTSRTKTARGGELSIAALVSLIDIATTNNTIAIIASGPIAKDIANKFGISRQRTASILDLFSSAFNGLLPYAGQLLVAGGIAGISPVSIMPYNWYSILMLVFGVIFILMGWPKFKTNNTIKNEKNEVIA